MSENYYASPEVVERVDTDVLREYRWSLIWLARGMMGMILSFVLGVGMAWLTEVFWWRYFLQYYNWSWALGFGMFCVLQLLGAVMCWIGASRLRWDAKWLIPLSGVLFVLMFGVGFIEAQVNSPPLISAMLVFGFSCWAWQAFLLWMAWWMESRWLMVTAGLVLLTFSIAGFATMYVFLQLRDCWQMWLAMISGVGYFGLYAILLIGTLKRLWTLVARSLEGVQ